ncbi:hypothetical protein K474DRAFT_1774942 [Panus rudis PR-1116 ss-1]|nr:hypothetical protein K474DRAFT_1774942 [Panus rudis PR-1116 ss-1]
MRLPTILAIGLTIIPTAFAVPLRLSADSQASVPQLTSPSPHLEADILPMNYGRVRTAAQVPPSLRQGTPQVSTRPYQVNAQRPPPKPQPTEPTAPTPSAVPGTGRYEGLKVDPKTKQPITAWDTYGNHFYTQRLDGKVIEHPDQEALRFAPWLGRKPNSDPLKKTYTAPDGKEYPHPVFDHEQYRDVADAEWGPARKASKTVDYRWNDKWYYGGKERIGTWLKDTDADGFPHWMTPAQKAIHGVKSPNSGQQGNKGKTS